MEFILSLLLCLSLPGQPVQWPVQHVPAPVVPPPSPAMPIAVPAGHLFVVTSDAPCALVPSPAGKVKVTTKHGPFDVYAKFVGGTGQFEFRTFTQKNVFIVEPDGSGVVELATVSGDLSNPTIDRRTLILGDAPAPKPDDPKPQPDAAPIPANGLHVLITIETSDGAKLPAKQVAILTAGSIRDYLDAKCPKVNGTPQYRIWDKDVDTRNESKLWQDAFARKRGNLPWIVVSNGKTGFEGPLPGTVEETLALLKRFGGE